MIETVAIDTELLEFVSIGELLGPDSPSLLIPDFQRPYSWTPHMAAQLFTDVEEALDKTPDQPYILGTIILLRRPNEPHFEVVDGQQRLLTLHLLRALLRDETHAQSTEGTAPIHRVHRELARLVSNLGRDADRLAGYRDFLDSNTKVLRIVTNDEDEAFQFFDSQNFRGKALRPHDLLKAFHLRELAEASTSEQRAVVEQWQQAEENDLDRLFSTFLARIHWWSRGLPAHDFTTDDLGLFKGIGRSARKRPAAEYHRAAQAVLPGLQAWAQPTPGFNLRDLKRAQHQLDAPIIAGRPFFDFAAFMLEEAQRLEEELDETLSPDSSPIDLRRSPRFRYCRELYVAAALYYTNKYSETEFLHRDYRRLFRWAFAPRLSYERLSWRSTDNYARGLGEKELSRLNIFAAIRDCLDPRELPLADVTVPISPKSKNVEDAELLRILEGGQQQ